MTQITVNTEKVGAMAMGVKTPIIRPGDDVKKIVIDSCLAAVGEFQDNAVIGITEAVVAIAQGNFATPEDIQADIARKYPDQTELTVMFPIQSRNRFMNIMQAIADMPQFEKIYVVLSYPCDEVWNRLVSDKAIFYNSNVDPHKGDLTAEEFYKEFGKPKHKFTGKNYIEEFQNTNPDKVEVRLCNDLMQISKYCENVLVCTIRREQREMHKEIMYHLGVKRVFDLSEILDESVNGSNYNPEYGLYGSNKMADGKLKLMPIDSQEFVEELQNQILEDYGKDVKVMVYGDGAFKDPVGGIWELADPDTTLGATDGLSGTPKEVKLKYLASKYPDKTQEELAEIVAKEKAERVKTNDVTGEASLGTTPRQITDLLASLMDLMSGSGDRQTPVVYVPGYLE